LRLHRAAAAGALAAAFLRPLAALADTVVLKNGDHLTGTVNQLAGGKLTVTTSYAGAVIITWDEVSSVKLDKPLILPIETRMGKKVDIKKVEVTGIDRTPTGFVVATATGPQPVPPAGLSALRTAAAEQAYEASLRPSFLHAWTGAANVSLAITGGNSETTSVGTGVNLTRVTGTDKTALYFNDVYSHDSVAGLTTADSTNAGLRYDHNVNPKLFTFGTADFNVNGLQYLNLRTILGGGFGWHAIAKPTRTMDVLGGIVWTHESYSSFTTAITNPNGTPGTMVTKAETNSFAALDFGEQYTQKFGKASLFTEQAYIFPDLQDTSQFRFTLNSAFSTKINNFLSWQTAFSDVYVTNPPSGTKDNDVVLTTGLGFTFTKK
jgi:putative salt-induced outer membrane protein YdiY